MPKFRRLWQAQLSDYVRGVAWSPAGDRLAAISAAGELVLWSSATTHQPVPLVLEAVGDRSLDTLGFSGEGRYLAVAGQAGQLRVWDVAGPEPEVVFERTFPSVWLDQLAWAPQGGELAIAIKDQIHLYDLPTQTQTGTLAFTDSSVLGLAWHPQGTYLAGCGHGQVKIWERAALEQTPVDLEVPGASLGAAWSADGQYLASGNLDRTLSVLHWGNPPPWLMQGFPGKVSQVAWAPQTPLRLAAMAIDGITIWQRQASNWTSEVLTDHQQRFTAIAFAPHADLLASGSQDGGILLWHQARHLTQKLKGLQHGTATLDWHPAGPYLASGGMAGEIVIWQAEAPAKGFG